MIPVVAATSISRIVCVAIFFLLVHKVPLLVELDFFRVGGKKPPILRGVFRSVRLQVWCSGKRYLCPLSTNVLFFAFRLLRRRVR